MTNELPEPWGPALSGKGVHSYGDMAAALGVSKATAHRLVNGATSVGTVRLAADAWFGGDENRVYDLRSSTTRSYGPWNPPEAVALLNPKQRAAIEAVIAAMVPANLPTAAPTDIEPAPAPAERVAAQAAELEKRAAASGTTKGDRDREQGVGA